MSSCISSCYCCSPTSDPKTRLEGLYNCIVITIKVVVAAILIATLFWLFIRLPEPSLYLKAMRIEAIEPNLNKPNSTLLHYNLTLHNGDLYKHLHYDVLVLRFGYSKYYAKTGFSVDFIENGRGKTISQRPGETTLLPNHTVDYSYIWENEGLKVPLLTQESCIKLRFVMEVRYAVFNRHVRHQIMRIAEVYFSDKGKAFINPRRGLKLK